MALLVGRAASATVLISPQELSKLMTSILNQKVLLAVKALTIERLIDFNLLLQINITSSWNLQVGVDGDWIPLFK